MATRKVGRPKKKIDYAQVEELASIFCTQQEIASVMDVSLRTLQNDENFYIHYKKGLEHAKMSLRRKQFKLAEKNTAMAIFLGKNYLGQKDVQTIDAEHRVQFEEKVKELSNKSPDELISEINQSLSAN